MFHPIKSTITSIALAGLIAAPLAVGVNVLSMEPAFAKNGNGNGGGNGGGKGNGGGNGGGGKSASAGKSAGAGSKSNGRGAINSELKWLNAANASPNALANANPNSNVGRIATYQTEAKVLVSAIVTLMKAQTALNTLQSGYTGRTSAEIQAEIDDPLTDPATPC